MTRFRRQEMCFMGGFDYRNNMQINRKATVCAPEVYTALYTTHVTRSMVYFDYILYRRI